MKARFGAVVRLLCLVLGASACLAGARAWAQTQAPTDCADFQTQAEAQTFYDEHKDDDPNNADPFDLDADGDGKACEGLPTAAGAQVPPGTSPAPTAAASPAPVGTVDDKTLPKNGVGTVAMALSGMTLLEAGYGMTLLSKRLGVRRRSVPVHLLRSLMLAAREGRNEVAISDDIYLVRRTPSSSTQAYVDHMVEGDLLLAPEGAEVEDSEVEDSEVDDFDVAEEPELVVFVDPPSAFAPSRPINGTTVTAGRVYAAVVSGAVDAPAVTPDADDEFAWAEDVDDDDQPRHWPFFTPPAR